MMPTMCTRIGAMVVLDGKLCISDSYPMAICTIPIPNVCMFNLYFFSARFC